MHVFAPQHLNNKNEHQFKKKSKSFKAQEILKQQRSGISINYIEILIKIVNIYKNPIISQIVFRLYNKQKNQKIYIN